MYATRLQLILVAFAAAACHNPTPAYPVPVIVKSDPLLEVAFSNLTHKVALIADESHFDTTSFSVSLTSEIETLWSHHHTAKNLDPERPGANPVGADSFYRVASITKIFTSHAILQLYASGKLMLDDPVSKYISKLKDQPSVEEGGIDWDHITIRSLASQISGIPRDWMQGDYLKDAQNHTLGGFPPPTNKHLPRCFEFGNYATPCNETDLYDDLHRHRPLFTPNQQPSYSNTAFELLGLVVANVSGMSYIDYVSTHILDQYLVSPGATFTAPADNDSVLTNAGAWYWNVDLGIHIPAGGLYANTNGLDQYLRTVLTRWQTPAFGGPNINMFAPQGYNFGVNSAYSFTWETFRTDKILADGRPVIFHTKGGGHPGYITIIIAVPDLGIGITILCAGDKASQVLDKIRETVTVEVVRALDRYAERYMQREYAGDFFFEKLIHNNDNELHGDDAEDFSPGSDIVNLNSSFSLAYSSALGLHVTSCVSNGTDMLAMFGDLFYGKDAHRRLQLRLIPTGQYASLHPVPNGERWSGIIQGEGGEGGIWDEFCINNVDGPQYDGRPLLEIVFKGDGREVVELTGLRVRLRRVVKEDRGGEEENEEEEQVEVDEEERVLRVQSEL